MQPSSTLASAAALAAVLLMVLPEAASIVCYKCNSKVDPDCENIAPGPANGTVGARFLVPCDEGPAGEPPFCRKSFIKVLHGANGEEETRWVRACGWVKYKNPCYMYDDEDHHETVCQCFEDGCNAATEPLTTLLLTAACGALALVLQAGR